MKNKPNYLLVVSIIASIYLISVNIINIVNYKITQKYEIDDARTSTIIVNVNDRKIEIEKIISYLQTSSILSIINTSIIILIWVLYKKEKQK